MGMSFFALSSYTDCNPQLPFLTLLTEVEYVRDTFSYILVVSRRTFYLNVFITKPELYFTHL
jgi:hypothetical protein